MIRERYELAINRIKEMATDSGVKYPEYFKAGAEFILLIDDTRTKIEEGFLKSASIEELAEMNERLYSEVRPENYESSFTNPTYAAENLDEYAKMLCYVYTSLRKTIIHIFRGVQFKSADPERYEVEWEQMLLHIELFIEIFVRIQDSECTKDYIKDIIYSFERDNSEIFIESQADCRLNSANNCISKMITTSDLSDTRYLYTYGLPVGDNEIKMAQFLSEKSQDEIDNIASIYTEGYRLGFINTGKDLSIKSTVEIVYHLGFERIVKAAIHQFEKMGLKPTMGIGDYQATSVNKQYEFDHKDDNAIVLDKAYMKRRLEVIRDAHEAIKDIAGGMAGPAVIEVFGETPFEPETNKDAISLSEKQQALQVEFFSQSQQILQKYIKGDERSFTIIAFPVPEFGDDFEEMFEETVKINSLDTKVYGEIQQKIIDALDQAEYVRVEGRGENKTHMIVQMHEMDDPAKETNFENCLADVNIPLGEVFTSPKLTDTQGTLHVSSVYLRDINFIDLELKFEDGKITEYTCKNFDDEEENKKLIKENIMSNHDTLPIGEFAIGTNTTAYKVAKEKDCIYKLPILIVEKMGPHFAVGDTCYSWEEDVETFNPDGKKIVAKENEVSSERKTDPSKAYMGCHTDITIPYEELGTITAVKPDGEEIKIIENGRFVLEGTDLLNEPLD